MKKSLFMLFACAALFACQNKEDFTPEEPLKFSGDEAYMTIRLADVGSLNTKALGGFEDADDKRDGFREGVVKSAHFYFYDANGFFVSEASAWRGEKDDVTTNDNIEFNSNNIIVLKGLTQKNYPKYMVTVLNQTSDFVHGTTLKEMEKAMSRQSLTAVTNEKKSNCLWNYVDDTEGKHNYFTMSTSSYTDNKRVALNAQGTVAADEVPYFVTLLKESDFQTEPAPEPDNVNNPVVVYVERLAAKVKLSTTMTGTEVTVDGTNDKKTMYELKVTLAGDDNNLGGTDGFENVYIDFTGWALNATAKNSYMSKNIDPSWSNLGFTWNDAQNYRSYWGKSFNYGDKNAKYHNVEDKTEYDPSSMEFPLHYIDFSSNNFVSLDTPLYCAENTNTTDILQDKNAVTNIMLRAKVYKETVAGNKIVKPLDMVRYNGVLYQNERFFDHILSIVNTSGKLNLYYATNKVGTTFTKLNSQFIKLEADGAGVKAVLKSDYATDADITWPLTDEKGNLYKYDGSTYSKVTDADLTNMIKDLNDALATASSGAAGFKGGDMYYTIRVQHANTPGTTLKEADYGIVRNHVYKVNINAVKKIGYAIFDEKVTTDIGGVGGGDEPDTYYVGTTINILSWKIVNQNVEL